MTYHAIEISIPRDNVCFFFQNTGSLWNVIFSTSSLYRISSDIVFLKIVGLHWSRRLFSWSRTNRWQDWLCSFQSHSHRQKLETTNLVILQLICYSWIFFIKSNQFVSYHRLRAKYECIKLTVWLHFCKIDHFTVLQLENFNKLIICRNAFFILYRKTLNDWSDDIHEWIMFFTVLLQKWLSRHRKHRLVINIWFGT